MKILLSIVLLIFIAFAIYLTCYLAIGIIKAIKDKKEKKKGGEK